jgi:hypothetical protein
MANSTKVCLFCYPVHSRGAVIVAVSPNEKQEKGINSIDEKIYTLNDIAGLSVGDKYAPNTWRMDVFTSHFTIWNE